MPRTTTTIVAAAALAVLAQASVARAGANLNGASLNGTNLNGTSFNGVGLNCADRDGLAAEAEATAPRRADGSRLRLREVRLRGGAGGGK